MRKSDPYHCNKCGEPLTMGGYCREEHAIVKAVPKTELIGRTHLGRLAAPVLIEPTREVAA